MTWSVVTLISTLDVTRVYEIQKGREDCKALRSESRELLNFVLIPVHQVVYELQLQFPCDILGVEIQNLVNELGGFWTTAPGVSGGQLVVGLGS